MTERIFDTTFGVLYNDAELVTKGMRFFAPIKANTLTEFRVLQVKYGTYHILNQIEMVCEDCNGQTTSFVFHYRFNEFGGYVTNDGKDIDLYDSVDDFVEHKKLYLHAVQSKVKFCAPFNSLQIIGNKFFGTEQIEYYAYVLRKEGVVKLKIQNRPFEIYQTKMGWLSARFIEPFATNTYFCAENLAKAYLRSTIKVEGLADSEKNMNDAHKVITIDVCIDDDINAILEKLIIAMN